MKNIWKNHKIKIISLIYVVIAGVLIYVAISYVTKRIVDKSDEIQARILDQEIETSRVRAIPKMEENYQYSQDNGKALEVLLSREEGVDFIKKMEGIAQETRNDISFKIEEIDQKKNTKPTTAKKDNAEKGIRESLSYDSYISIQIDLKGDYNSLINFINKLENTRNYVNIIALESKTEKETANNSADSNQGTSIFSSTPAAGDSEKSIEKKEKDILHSTISIVIYVKK